MAGGLRIAIDGPEGAPWIVFSNSLATDLSLWDPQVEAFAPRWRLLRYDYHGHGGSAPAAVDRCGTDRLAADLLAVMDAAGAAVAVHVGVSMGSLAGIAAALESPRRFRGLVIGNARLKSSPATADSLERRAALAMAQDMDALVAPTLSKWFAGSALAPRAALCERIAAMIRAVDAKSYAAYARGTQDYDLESRMGHIAMPTLLLAGTCDGGVDREFDAIARRHPRMCFAAVEGAGHLPGVQAPARFNSVLRDFLAGLPASA